MSYLSSELLSILTLSQARLLIFLITSQARNNKKLYPLVIQCDSRHLFCRQYFPYVLLSFKRKIGNVFFKCELSPQGVWQYGLWSFKMGGTKLERFLPKNQHKDWPIKKLTKVYSKSLFEKLPEFFLFFYLDFL